ncbi:hypothetical protein JCM3765_007606 [Sporobolomyces pararoseus]
MSLHRSVARLPDEVIIEIFRNSVLSQADLSNCCLLARRFAEKARLLLYGNLEFLLIGIQYLQGVNSEGDWEVENRHEYTAASRKLLRTLFDEPSITQYVRKINLDILQRRKRVRNDSPGFETTPLAALSTCLRLGPQVKSIYLGYRWPASIANLQIIKSCHGITELTMSVVENEQIGIIAREFPNLKRLSLWQYAVDTSTTATTPQLPRQLDAVYIFSVPSPPQLLLVSASAPTLRTLSVHIKVGAELDYANFPALEDLRFTSTSTSTDDHLRCSKFWTSLCQSKSLHTLTFDNSQQLSTYDKLLYRYSTSGIYGPLRPIPTL